MNDLYQEYEQALSVNGGALSEAQIRSLVGAPSIEESETCMCGEALASCPNSYEHMTHGV